MKKFLHVVDRLLIHAYLLAGLGLVLLSLLNQLSFDRAEFELLQVQTKALLIISQQIHGLTT